MRRTAPAPASGRHLLDVLSDIMDVARVEAGRIDLDREPVPVRQLVETCETIVGGRIRGKHRRFMVTIGKGAEILYADLRLVRQVLLNLLSNAARFTPDGGSIALAARRTRAARYQSRQTHLNRQAQRIHRLG